MPGPKSVRGSAALVKIVPAGTRCGDRSRAVKTPFPIGPDFTVSMKNYANSCHATRKRWIVFGVRERKHKAPSASRGEPHLILQIRVYHAGALFRRAIMQKFCFVNTISHPLAESKQAGPA